MRYNSKRLVSLVLVLLTVLSCLPGMIVSAETEDPRSSVIVITVPQTPAEEEAPAVLSASEGEPTLGGDTKAAGGKVTSITVDSGNNDKSKVSCLGGSFKAVVKGTNLYNKIAVFDGTTKIGSPVLVGKAGSTDTSATIESGKFNLPPNNYNIDVTYNILVFPGDIKDGDITAANGTKMATVKVESRRDAFEISTLKLNYSPEGGSSYITFKANCNFNATVTDSSWLRIDPVNGEYRLKITASPNSGADRKNTIVFSHLEGSSSNQTITINISQTGLDNLYRLSGSNRVTTSTAISYYGWEKANTVILASGVNFADALAGAPLSAAVDGPILLTMNKKDGAEKALLDEIKRLGAKKVYILGGTSAVNSNIEKDIKAQGCTVVRLKGQSRYGTAVAIAQELSKVTGKSFSKLYFTNAANYPDALSVSAVAAIEGNPILYMPTTGKVESTTKAFVTESKCKTGVVLGGTGAVSKTGYDSLANLGLSMSRISGKDRYKTSIAINEKYASLFSGKEAALATGINFPDALAGSGLCAKLKMPVVLASEKSYKDAYDYLRSDANKNLEFIFVYGGTGTMSHKLIVDIVYED